MYSWYVVHRTAMVNNNDTVTDCFVLSEREDLLQVLETLDINPALAEYCSLWVYREGELDAKIDLLATVPDAEDDEDVRPPDLTGITIPALTGAVLPPGHPIVINGEPLHYGCTSFYN